jgi:hypothetical protein
MKWCAGMVLLCAVFASSVWAGEPEPFDPDQPFNQALSERMLESLLSQGLAALNDHVEIFGSMDSESGAHDRKQTFRFKFYPEGKSKSDEHITAEAWLGPSEDSRRREFHFRFAVPRSPDGSSQDSLGNVL